jgi:Tfp pilus assembly protein PilF
VDALQQNVIFRKYGDFLYQKGDYDTAMQQYLRAIDNTEPSQVIRKVRVKGFLSGRGYH